MLPLDVPFVPDGDYPDFLAERQDSLASVHFSLYDPALGDARQRIEGRDLTAITSGLAKLDRTPKYVLMNARLHSPDKYFAADTLRATATLLSRLVDEASIDGLIFADPYYLQALSDGHPDVAERLEAVPSVNALLDSADRAFAMLDMIGATAFKPPTKLVLDRSLNRDMDRLNQTCERLKKSHPSLKVHLIANEGCLYQCPYKPAHDAHVALVNEGLCGERTFAMNRDFGCVRRFLSDPGNVLTSPFIRPEDTGQYASLADAIKICGRNRGIDFLKKVITAYLGGQYEGNLLDLMDAMGDLADRLDIPNHRLPKDFLARVARCDKDCNSCAWCTSLADELVTRLDPGLPKL